MPRPNPIFRKRCPSWRLPVEALTFALYFLCGVLLILSRIGHGTLADARDQLTDLTSPVFEAASAPVIGARRAVERVRSYSEGFGELDRLRQENERLREWEWRAKLLEGKVEQLRKLLGAVDEPALHFTTGNVIADARGPFVRSALVNLGREQGVRAGYAVINGDGLVGRTLEAGSSVTRVLLLNDLNSRIPVLVGPAALRGIVAGDNSSDLTLDFIPDGASLYVGDEVYTSGSDGVLPRGLRVGIVRGREGRFKVRPHADLSALDIVSVLFFNTPTLASASPAIAPNTCELPTVEGPKSPSAPGKVSDAESTPPAAAKKMGDTGTAMPVTRVRQ